MDGPTRRPRLKIKIKVGKKDGTSKAVPDSGNAAGPLSSGLDGASRAKAQHARSMLDGLPAPSEGVASIVRVLQQAGDVFEVLPSSWEDDLALPRELAEFALALEGGVPAAPPRKKRRRASVAQEGAPQASAAGGNDAREQVMLPMLPGADAKVAEPRSSGDGLTTADEPMPAAKPMQASPVNDMAGEELARGPGRPYCQGRPVAKTDESGAMQVCPHGSSTSDEANNQAIPSPEGQGSENMDAKAGAGPGSTAAAPCAPVDKPSAGCQAGPGVLLAPSCLEPVGGVSAAAAAMYSISPFDMLMPSYQRQPTASVNDAFVSRLISRARELKHATDRKRGSTSAPWTIGMLCTYVESALTFMEACEYIARSKATVRTKAEGTERLQRAATLYSSTAQLLTYIAKSCESAMGPDPTREALRLLAERLCAVCAAKEALHTSARYHDGAAKAASLASRVSNAQLSGAGGVSSQHRQHHGGGAGGHQRHPAVVTDDSTNSSPAAGVASAAPQQLLQASGDRLVRLLDMARGVSRFASLMRRSTLGFQTFIERPDLRDSQPFKVASMHIAAVSMDAGLGHGFSTLSHARQAVECIRGLLR